MKDIETRVLELEKEISEILGNYTELIDRHHSLLKRYTALSDKVLSETKTTGTPAMPTPKTDVEPFKKSLNTQSGIVNIGGGAAAVLFPYSSELVYSNLLDIGELAAQALRYTDNGCDYTPKALAGAASIIELLLHVLPEDIHYTRFQGIAINESA